MYNGQIVNKKSSKVGYIQRIPAKVGNAQTRRLTKTQIEKHLTNPNVLAFLDLIAWSEGGRYNNYFGGRTFSSYAKHPNICVSFTWNGRRTCSTASGRYQFLYSTWRGIQRKLGLPNFSPRNQDIACVYMIWQRKALGYVVKGDVVNALKELAYPCSWAGLALSRCGQGRKNLNASIRYFNGALKVFQSRAGITKPVIRQNNNNKPVKASPLNVGVLANTNNTTDDTQAVKLLAIAGLSLALLL